MKSSLLVSLLLTLPTVPFVISAYPLQTAQSLSPIPHTEQSKDSGIVTIPASLNAIPPYAFADRHDIRKVIFEQGSKCTSIGDFAFLGCDSISEINLPPDLSSLGEGAFRECSALQSITLPRGIKVIPPQCFSGCTALSTVSSLSQLREIKPFAFIYCEALESFDFGNQITHIDHNAFSRCTSLTEVRLPASVINLDSYAFSDCLSLREVTLPANDHTLGELIFSGCEALHEIIQPSPRPPKFECNSTLFEYDSPLFYQIFLRVPAASLPLYLSSPTWAPLLRQF